MLDFAGADAKRQRAERPVRGRVTIAADHRHAGLRQPEFRADHVHDALMTAMNSVAGYAEIAAILFKLRQLIGGDCIDACHGAVASAGGMARGRGPLVAPPPPAFPRATARRPSATPAPP